MTYDLNEILAYTESIDAECPGIRSDFKQQDNWPTIERDFYFYRDALERDNHDFALRNYALAIKYAIAFLLSQAKDTNRPIEPNKQEQITEGFKYLQKTYRETFPQSKLKPPLPILEPSKPRVGPVDPEFQEFLDNSQELKDLKKYLHQVLNKDSRSHSFFCCVDFRVKGKVKVLNQFICDLTNLSTREEAKDFLTAFYNEKGKAHHQTKAQSRFDILSTGQNITTKFFTYFSILSWFNVQATTIDLIDNLAKSIELDPKKIVRDSDTLKYF